MEVLGIDPAFSNMGLVRAVVNVEPGGRAVISAIQDMRLITTSKDQSKTVRASSDSLKRAKELHEGFHGFLGLKKLPTLAFAEVPSGAQSAVAAKGLGIAVGILASCPCTLVEVAPREVKALFQPGKGEEEVSKAVIIAWAFSMFPKAPWMMRAGKRTQKNEHLADALATIEAGLRTPQFKQAASLLQHHHETPTARNDRPPLPRRPRR